MTELTGTGPQPAVGPRRVIIDTDPGLGEPGSDIDDGLAIALALRSPELEVAGLTIVNGNVDGWAVTGNVIHDDNNIGIDAIGFEDTISGAARTTIGFPGAAAALPLFLTTWTSSRSSPIRSAGVTNGASRSL